MKKFLRESSLEYFLGDKVKISGDISVKPKFFRNFGIAFLVPYNKDFGRITRF